MWDTVRTYSEKNFFKFNNETLPTNIKNSAGNKMRIWLWFIEDTFMIYTHGEKELSKDHNQFYPTIKFTGEQSFWTTLPWHIHIFWRWAIKDQCVSQTYRQQAIPTLFMVSSYTTKDCHLLWAFGQSKGNIYKGWTPLIRK